MNPYFSDLDLGVICGGVRNYKTFHLVNLMEYAKSIGYSVMSNLFLSARFGCYVHLDSEDPSVFISNLRYYLEKRYSEKDYSKVFLGIDEFSGIADSVNWKINNKDSDIWKQLGKLGVTCYVTNQAFSMTYNRYRDNANVKIITKRLIDGHYLVSVFHQSADDHELYNLRMRYLVGGSRVEYIYSLYDTHQLMYSRKV